MPRPLTAKGLELLHDLPPRLRGAPEYQAAMHCMGREADRLDATVDTVIAQGNPLTADPLLKGWEAVSHTTLEPVGQDLAQRRTTVLALLRKQNSSPAGLDWERNVTALVGAGWDYQEHIPGDATSPPESTIRVILPFPPTSDRYMQTETLLRDITPAAWDLIVTFAGGFVLDESRLDQEELR